jgi:chromosomal replication initiation ATPase DnaA
VSRDTFEPRQIPLDLAHTTGLSRDELVVCKSNASAVSLIDSWPQWPANFMIVAGPPGSGKSHLASIWAERAGAMRIAIDELSTASSALATGANVLLDGIGETAFDETALFHLINAVRQNGGSLLVMTRKWPSSWKVALPDLLSRVKSAPTIEIAEPDDSLLSGVILKLFADRQLMVDPNVVSYLVSRIERSLATAQSVVERLDKAALESKSRITRQLAATVLTEMDQGQKTLEF